MTESKISDDLTEWLNRLFSEQDKKKALSKLRASHQYLADLIRLLERYPNGLPRQTALGELERQRKKDGLPIPPKFENSVQSVYNRYSVDSAVFHKRNAPPEEALFYSPAGKGSGMWAVDKTRAIAWLKSHLNES